MTGFFSFGTPTLLNLESLIDHVLNLQVDSRSSIRHTPHLFVQFEYAFWRAQDGVSTAGVSVGWGLVSARSGWKCTREPGQLTGAVAGPPGEILASKGMEASVKS